MNTLIVLTVHFLGQRTLESAASEFFVAFFNNLEEGQETVLTLFISTPEPQPVNFTVDTIQGFSYSGVVYPGSPTSVVLPNSLQITSSSEQNKGIYISTKEDKRIVVYGLSYQVFSSDAFLALPCNPLAVDEYEYYAVTAKPDTNNFPSYILLVGCEDDTTISVSSTTFTLNRLETYLIESPNDQTGKKVVSNKPITFLTGDQCSDVPPTANHCDMLIEQVPPTNTWGSSFLSASFLGRSSGDIYRVLSSEDSANVVVSCTTLSEPLSETLAQSGDFYEFEVPSDSFCSIESTKPVLVMEFGLGNTRDGVGDPFLLMIPPLEQYYNTYVLNVLEEFSLNSISVFVAPNHFQPGKIILDGEVVNASWTQVHCALSDMTCGYVARIPLQPGSHQLQHTNADGRIGVVAYGFNHANSYGYPGGLQVIPLQCKLLIYKLHELNFFPFSCNSEFLIFELYSIRKYQTAISNY